MNQMDLIHKFHSTLPMVRTWIENTLEEHSANATPVISLPFPRLNSVFPLELLAMAKVVVVNGAVPFPPLSRMGLPEFSQMENMQKAGITYKDTYFISHLHQTESLPYRCKSRRASEPRRQGRSRSRPTANPWQRRIWSPPAFPEGKQHGIK